jgi:hypothetical protein
VSYHEPMMKRRAPLVLSLAFFFSSVALYHHVAPRTEVSAPVCQQAPVCQRAISVVAQAPVQDQRLQVEGVWEQYSIDYDGQRVFMARLEIRSDGLHYLATPTEIAEDVFPKQTYRSFDHRFQSGVWTFREAWDHGEVGEFVLRRQENGEFVGSAYLSGCPEERFATVFVRIGD